MRPFFEDIDSKRGQNSYLAYQYSVPSFPFQWHYHPEYELTLILEGSGERLVGDSHEPFSAGDLVLLGPGLPHTWVSDEKSAAVVIQFTEAFAAPLLQYPECERIRRLLVRSSQGLQFAAKTSASHMDSLLRLPQCKAVTRISALLQVLGSLSSKNARPLASPYFQAARGRKAESRINTVCRYIQTHSTGNISLRDIAALVNLSESAFCKFFKRTTGKTFSDYLVDIRLGHACHLLTETDDNIAEIAYLSGFDSLTYFNRVFLKKKGLRPREFRKATSGNNNDGGKVPFLRGKN